MSENAWPDPRDYETHKGAPKAEERAYVKGIRVGRSLADDEVEKLRDRLRCIEAMLEDTADFLETTSAVAARRDEPEMARICSTVSDKIRAVLGDA